jgi:phosphatidylinositol kinase/protein kinase (PI-3  family)
MFANFRDEEKSLDLVQHYGLFKKWIFLFVLRADIRVQETWYEKLQDWTEALRAYEKKQETNKEDVELMLGRMRCLESLGEWGQLHEVCDWDLFLY